MIQKIYAVKDIVADEFQPPFFVKNDAVAIKEFGKACDNKETLWHQFPNDYSLYALGEFDTETGSINSSSLKQLANASQFVNKEITNELNSETRSKKTSSTEN